MATFVFTDAVVTVGGTDLSNWVKQVTLDYQAEEQDDTFMGDTTRSATGGLKAWSGSIEFGQDFAASAPDVTLFSIIGTLSQVVVKPTSASTGATNPAYTGTALLTSYGPFGNSVGDLATTTLSFTAAGDLSRATS